MHSLPRRFLSERSTDRPVAVATKTATKVLIASITLRYNIALRYLQIPFNLETENLKIRLHFLDFFIKV